MKEKDFNKNFQIKKIRLPMFFAKLFNIVNLLLNFFDMKIVRNSRNKILLENEEYAINFKLLKIFSLKNRIKTLKYFSYSQSQLRQDLLVLNTLNFKKRGFFCEFGVCDGIIGSNTYLLEKQFEWSGIVCEPSKNIHKRLQKNRKCFIDNNCVYKTSGEKILFTQTVTPELSTISKYINSDVNSYKRINAKQYDVKTIALYDLLEKYNAPNVIDYLSIDTEGSEFSILENFDFNKYKFKIITVEHNFNNNRDKIYKLMLRNGYIRKYTEISFYDDWYFNKNLI